jgi:hypothetical protein
MKFHKKIVFIGIDMKKGRDSKLVEVHKVMGSVEAEVVKSLLESYGIMAVLQSLIVQSVHPFTVNGLGEIKIMVTEEDYEAARDIIDKTLKNK